jgi:hypothetical protein
MLVRTLIKLPNLRPCSLITNLGYISRKRPCTRVQRLNTTTNLPDLHARPIFPFALGPLRLVPLQSLHGKRPISLPPRSCLLATTRSPFTGHDATPALLARCHLYVDRESRALICRQCKFALATANSQVTTHLDRKHGVSKELRKGLTKHLRQHPGAFRDLSSIPLRPQGSTAHPELQVHEGFACRRCEFYTISIKQMTSHLCKLHLRERPSKSRTYDLCNYVFLQTWGDGPTRRYWTVAINRTTLRPLRLPHADEHLRLVREREQACRKEQQSIALSNMGARTLQNTGP